MKRAIPIIILLCLVIVFIPVSGSDASDEDNGLWINGEKITGSVTKEKWSYDLDNNTLTLNGASFSESYKGDGVSGWPGWTFSSPIYDGRDDSTLKIVLYGDNEILPHYSSVGDNYSCGVFSKNNVEISGTGSLHIHGDEYKSGFLVNRHLTIDGGVITIEDLEDLGSDIYIPNRIHAEDGGFTIKKGTLNLSGRGDMDIDGSMYFQGGTVTTVCNFNFAFLASGTAGYDGVFDMTGGIVTFTNTNANQILAKAYPFEVLTKIVLNLHDAPKNNVIQSDNTLSSMNAGEASFGTAPLEYTITFDANEGTCAIPSVFTEKDGNLASLPDATLDGYKFDGWYTEKDGGDEITTSTVFTKNSTIYAHWSKDSSGNNDNNLGLYIGAGIAVIAVIAIAGVFFFKRK